MIPRLKPYLGREEFFAPYKNIPNSVSGFELEFARSFQTKHALAFPYGRSALWSFFKALSIRDSEIILPAYTCSVVAHAIVLSNNIPRFVDINLSDYSMDLDQVESAITSNTRAVIATHLFGYPLDFSRLKAIVEKAEARYGRKIWIIQDCAHSFGAIFQGELTANQPDAAIFGLNISKTITSIFGGMLTTDDELLANTIRTWRNDNFRSANFTKTIRRWLYLLAIYPAFFEPAYRVIYDLQFRTTMLNRLTRAYHLDDQILFPPGYDEFMLPIEAKVGLAQIPKYPEIIRLRQAIAAFYHERIVPRNGWVMPPLSEGSTYSHYVIRVPDRKMVMEKAAMNGIQLGELIEYCIPYLPGYRKFAGDQEFPNSLFCSHNTINLPIFASLTQKQLERVATVINNLV